MGTSQSAVLNNCVGNNPDIQGQKLYSYWKNDDSCYNEFYKTMYFDPNGGTQIAYQPQRLLETQLYITELIQRYLAVNKFTTPGSPGYDQYQEIILGFCRDFPGTCDLAIKFQVCDRITGTNDEIRAKIAADPILTKLCGCFSPNPSSPLLTTSLKECDPLCTRIGTLPLADYNTGQALSCKSDVCVIDNVSITATQSQVGGGVQISQICSNCRGSDGGSCKCVLAGIDIDTIGSSIGLKGQFNSYCDPTSQCFVTDPTNPSITTAVSCDILRDSSVKVTSPSSIPSFWLLGWIFAIFIAILVFVIIIKVNSKPKIRKLPGYVDISPGQEFPEPSYLRAVKANTIIRSEIPKPINT